jgi:aspartyl-tRNA(Asn)/glutamyl-tRNA(Gln) amidotransferase subunit A
MTDAEQLVWSSAWSLRERLVAGELSAVELVEALLAHIESTEPTVHAFVTIAPDGARAAARDADAARQRGEPLGALHGVPVVVKDDLWTAGIRTTGGSRLYEDWVPTVDAVAVARIRAAGGILLAKANLPEFAAFPRCVNLVAPETRNPWDTSRTTGGSSGGPAAAVAAGMAPLAVGTDGGGSIRLPAALCGVVGMLPTPGRIPNIGNLDHCVPGPMARDVRDVALLLDVLAGPDPRDPNCLPGTALSAVAGMDGGVAGLRVGWSERLSALEWGDPRVVAAALEGLETIVDEGAQVQSVDVPRGDLWWAHRAVAAGRHRYGPPPTPDWDSGQARRREPGAREQMAPYLASAVPAPPPTRAEYDEAMGVRAATRAAYDTIFGDHAVVACPTIPVVAPVITPDWESPFPSSTAYTANTVVANFAGFPAVSVPVGVVEGLPVGVQLVGPPDDEPLVLRVARALERAVDRAGILPVHAGAQ